MADNKFDPLSESTAFLSKWRSPQVPQTAPVEPSLSVEPAPMPIVANVPASDIQAVSPEIPTEPPTQETDILNLPQPEGLWEQNIPLVQDVPSSINVETQTLEVFVPEDKLLEEASSQVVPAKVQTEIPESEMPLKVAIEAPKVEVEVPKISFERPLSEMVTETVVVPAFNPNDEIENLLHESSLPSFETIQTQLSTPKPSFSEPVVPVETPLSIPEQSDVLPSVAVPERPVTLNPISFVEQEPIAPLSTSSLKPIANPNMNQDMDSLTLSPSLPKVGAMKAKNAAIPTSARQYSFKERLGFLAGGTLGGIIISSLILPSVFVKFGASMVIILCAMTAGVIFWMNKPIAEN